MFLICFVLSIWFLKTTSIYFYIKVVPNVENSAGLPSVYLATSRESNSHCMWSSPGILHTETGIDGYFVFMFELWSLCKFECVSCTLLFFLSFYLALSWFSEFYHWPHYYYLFSNVVSGWRSDYNFMFLIYFYMILTFMNSTFQFICKQLIFQLHYMCG